MSVYLSKRADYVKLYLALWLVAFIGLWVTYFHDFSSPFRVTTVSYFLVYLAALVGAYFILAPLFQSKAITSEKSKWLGFVPALLLILHWFVQQLAMIFSEGGRLVYFAFNILVDQYFILFLFLGLVLYLLAAESKAMDNVFTGIKNSVRLFVTFAFMALGLISLAQIIQAFSALVKIGAGGNNYSHLAASSTGGLVAALVINLVLLLVPLCGWVLLQKLLEKATAQWDKLLKLPARWLGVVPLVLIGLAALIQPKTFFQSWFIIAAVFAFISILVEFLAASKNPVALGIVKLAESFFLYPLRYFRKIVGYGKKDLEITENENAGIDYFCFYIKGFICFAILVFWTFLAVLPIMKYYGLHFLPTLPMWLPLGTMWISSYTTHLPLDHFHALLIYPLAYFICVPMYALFFTLFYEVAIIVLQILVKINKFFTKVLQK